MSLFSSVCFIYCAKVQLYLKKSDALKSCTFCSKMKISCTLCVSLDSTENEIFSCVWRFVWVPCTIHETRKYRFQQIFLKNWVSRHCSPIQKLFCYSIFQFSVISGIQIDPICVSFPCVLYWFLNFVWNLLGTLELCIKHKGYLIFSYYLASHLSPALSCTNRTYNLTHIASTR